MPPLARATQPYAVSRNTDYPNLMKRLQTAFESLTSRDRFKTVGFEWRFTGPSL